MIPESSHFRARYIKLDTIAIIFSIVVLAGATIATVVSKRKQHLLLVKQRQALERAVYLLVSCTWRTIGTNDPVKIQKANKDWVICLPKTETDYFREILGTRQMYMVSLDAFDGVLIYLNLTLKRSSPRLTEDGCLEFVLETSHTSYLGGPALVCSNPSMVRDLISPFDVIVDEVDDTWDWLSE